MEQDVCATVHALMDRLVCTHTLLYLLHVNRGDITGIYYYFVALLTKSISFFCMRHSLSDPIDIH
jgi:hypothetical protein